MYYSFNPQVSFSANVKKDILRKKSMKNSEVFGKGICKCDEGNSPKISFSKKYEKE
jgi:hypothetical protein